MLRSLDLLGQISPKALARSSNMAAATTAASELARVRFEPTKKVEKESDLESDDNSEPESLEEEEVAGDAEYEVGKSPRFNHWLTSWVRRYQVGYMEGT